MALQEELKQQGDYLFKYRSYLPLGLLIIALALKWYLASDSSTSLLSDILESSALWVGLLGLLVRVFTVGYTPENTSGRNTDAGQVADVLNTTGIYSLIRNPLYVGNLLMWLAVAMLTGSIWFVLLFIMFFWIYYERIVYAEESFLRDKFGQSYLDWTEHTPIFLPRHLRYKAPSIPFSWKKVLKKEKNGLFALFLLIWIFKLVGDYAAQGNIRLTEGWEFYAALVTGILYFILRFLKRRTALLEEVGR